MRRADNLRPSCADCLEIWEPQTPGTLRECTGITLPSTAEITQYTLHRQPQRCSVGGIVQRLRAGRQKNRGSIPGRARDFFSFIERLSYHRCVTGTLYVGIGGPGRVADHSPPSSVEVKNDIIITPLPHMLGCTQ